MADENWDEFGDCEIVPDTRYDPDRWDKASIAAEERDDIKEQRRENYGHHPA